MANPAPFVYIDPSAAPDTRRRSADPHVLERSTNAIIYYLYTSLPDLPVSAAAALSSLAPAPGEDGGVDRISALPDALLGKIVSRLPIKDAGRTAALSRRWRPIWRSARLAVDDTNLRPRALVGRAPTRADSPVLTAAVSRVLVTHPGPFRAVYLVRSYMDAHQESLKLWLRMLVLKGVEELVLVNRPWPLDLPLPVTLLNITTLTRLFIGVWKFPDTSGLARGAGFPNLRELILCCVVIKNQDMDFVLARSPALETLGLQGIQEGIRLRLVGRRLQCVQICLCVVESITIVDAPRLERLILWGSLDGSCIRLKIEHAPKLRLLGYLELEMHKLESGDSIINAGKRTSPSTMSPSVEILSFSVRFGVRSDVRMLPTFLRCFPNVETLHIKSDKSNEATGKVNLKFWQEAGAIESVRSSIKVMSFHDFRGERSELAFLKFFLQNARVLQTVVIVTDSGCPISIDDLQSKVRSLDPDKWASQDCSLMVHIGSDPEGGALWDFRKGLDVSVGDPFVCY